MNSLPSVGIIGCGFVGTAVLDGFKYVTDVVTYDKFKPGNSDADFNAAAQQDVIFVCVPTPADKLTGACDTSIVEEVLSRINNRAAELELIGRRPVIIKSTIPHNFCRQFQDFCLKLVIIHSPEFLTERRASHDFATQTRVILGTSGLQEEEITAIALKKVIALFKGTFGEKFPVLKVSWEEAGLLKYALNCFLATKISFMNELTEICEASGVEAKTVIDLMKGDGRISVHHMEVPGPDGQFGFGGACFPKDCEALISIALQLGVEPKVLIAAVEKNHQVRDKPVKP
jgi:UDPglucose 6-dehydrogenase